MKKRIPIVIPGVVLGTVFGALAGSAFGQAGEGPALGANRITQADIESGLLRERDIRRKGLEIFSTPFNKHDGYGDGPASPVSPAEFGGRPTISGNSTWLRVNGLDSQTCLECHSVASNARVPATFAVGGSGGVGASAFPGVTEFDIGDEDRNGWAEINGRVINPPFVFGAGGVELLAKEMTRDLQAQKAAARSNPGAVVALESKGVSFGSISYDAASEAFDLSDVEGIDPETLAVQPFGRKGDNSSIRAFDVAAMQFHHGMQPEEVTDDLDGDGRPDPGVDVDADGDGVVNEILVGEISALHVFSVSLERPRVVGGNQRAAREGERIFLEAGCADCHVPSLETESRSLPLAFPEVITDPSANVFYEVDLTGPAGFRPNGRGGVTVPLFSDLKRHDMGPGLAEATGDPLDPFFITPRLWGVADSAPYLHDGRALTLTEAIQAHGGEGQASADAFSALPDDDKRRLLTFLRTLRTPERPSRDIL